MPTQETELGVADLVKRYLPYLRRYARALTGSQQVGDAEVAATLQAIVTDPKRLDRSVGDKVALYRAFHEVRPDDPFDPDGEANRLEMRAREHLSKLTLQSREALLLSAIEEFTSQEIAAILKIGHAEVRDLLVTAFRDMEDAVAGRILIIEDEAVIALELEALIHDCGHSVTSVARTRDAARRLGAKERPDLILADIRLADGSSGIDAVNDLLRDLGDIPVIFITAYPERLLTGERPEPAFLITKPFTEAQVRAAVSQAMFFASTETLFSGS